MKITRFAVLISLVLASFPARADTGTCAVANIQGSAGTLWRDGQGQPLRVAMTLDNRDRIETGEGTIVRLACAQDIEVTIGPVTELELSGITAQDEGWVAFLMNGAAWFARPFFSEERFEVRTPSAVASVRSTEWFVTVDEGATAVFVDKGKVAVGAAQGGGLLEKGRGIDVTANGVSGPVRIWGASRVSALRQRLGFAPE